MAPEVTDIAGTAHRFDKFLWLDCFALVSDNLLAADGCCLSSLAGYWWFMKLTDKHLLFRCKIKKQDKMDNYSFDDFILLSYEGSFVSYSNLYMCWPSLMLRSWASTRLFYINLAPTYCMQILCRFIICKFRSKSYAAIAILTGAVCGILGLYHSTLKGS